MIGTEERLIYMANQIARNFASLGEGAVDATANHIAQFWDPRMRSRILAADPQQIGLSDIAAGAFQLLRERAAAKTG